MNSTQTETPVPVTNTLNKMWQARACDNLDGPQYPGSWIIKDADLGFWVAVASSQERAEIICKLPGLLLGRDRLLRENQALREALSGLIEVTACRSLSHCAGRGAVEAPAMLPAYGKRPSQPCDCCVCVAATEARAALAIPEREAKS